jgi:hypothetical protein
MRRLLRIATPMRSIAWSRPLTFWTHTNGTPVPYAR